MRRLPPTDYRQVDAMKRRYVIAHETGHYVMAKRLGFNPRYRVWYYRGWRAHVRDVFDKGATLEQRRLMAVAGPVAEHACVYYLNEHCPDLHSWLLSRRWSKNDVDRYGVKPSADPVTLKRIADELWKLLRPGGELWSDLCHADLEMARSVKALDRTAALADLGR